MNGWVGGKFAGHRPTATPPLVMQMWQKHYRSKRNPWNLYVLAANLTVRQIHHARRRCLQLLWHFRSVAVIWPNYYFETVCLRHFIWMLWFLTAGLLFLYLHCMVFILCFFFKFHFSVVDCRVNASCANVNVEWICSNNVKRAIFYLKIMLSFSTKWTSGIL